MTQRQQSTIEAKEILDELKSILQDALEILTPESTKHV